MSDEETYKNLEEAVRESDVERVRDILLKNSDLLNSPFESYAIELHAKVLRIWIGDCMNLEILELLVSSKQFIKSEEQLKIALYRGNVRLIELLLKNGVPLGTLEKDKILSILNSFFKHSDTRKDMLQYLLKNGILDIGFKNNFNLNLLGLFIESIDKDSNDEVDFAEYLMCLGVSIHKENENGETPLFYAIKKKMNKLVSFLIEKGSDVNKGSDGFNCPIVTAIDYGNRDAVELLLLKGVDVNATYYLGWRALHSACNKFNFEIITLLVQKGADISVVDRFGRTAFSYIDYELYEGEDYGERIINMVKEFSKLKFENISISESDINQIDKYLVTRRHFEEHVNELVQISSTKFYGSLTYYSLLKMSTGIKKLALLTKNEDIVSKFEADLNRFSCFEEDLRKVWEEAVQIREKFEAVIDRLSYVFGNLFPEIVIRKLAENLNLDDLPLE